MLELVSESLQVNHTTTLRWGEERAFRSSLLTGYMGLKIELDPSTLINLILMV